MGIMSVPSETLLRHFRGCKYGYLFLGQKQTGAERVTVAATLTMKFVSFVMDIYGARFQEHCFDISRDIVQYSGFTSFQLQ